MAPRALAPAPVVATEAGARVDPELLGLARELMTEHRTPGVGIGVTHRGSIAVAGLGVTNIENPVPVNGDTCFQIASITKTMTGTAVMRLIEDGAVELDAPVRRYLPDFAVVDQAVSERVTLRHLLTHSAGWDGDFMEDCGWGDDAIRLVVERMRDLRQVTPLGTMWAYNNAAFYVLGRILEVLHGEPFDRVMRTVLFDPLGMDDACFFAHDVMLRRHVVGHAIGPHGLQLARPWAMPRSFSPAAGVAASPRDLMRFARLHLRTLEGAGHVVSRATLDLMHAPALPAGTVGDETGMRPAITWFVDDRGGPRLLFHPGGANGQSSYIGLVPAESFGLVVLANCWEDHAIALELMRWARRRYFGAEDAALDPVPGADFGDLSAFEGTYDCRHIRYEVRRDADVLKLDVGMKADWLDGMDPKWPATRDVELVPIGRDTAIPARAGGLLDGPDRAVFLRDEAGEVRWLHHWLRAARKVR